MGGGGGCNGLHAIPQRGSEQGRRGAAVGRPRKSGRRGAGGKGAARCTGNGEIATEFSKAGASWAMYSVGAADKVLSARMESPARVSAGKLPPMDDFRACHALRVSGRW